MSLKHFSNLIQLLSTETNAQLQNKHLSNYFEKCAHANEKDCALHLLLNESPPKLIQAKLLNSWAAELTGYPDWLIERSEQEVGNPVKTLAMLMSKDKGGLKSDIALTNLIGQIQQLGKADSATIKSYLAEELTCLTPDAILVALKLITGSFRSPVSEQIVITSLASVLSIDHRILCLRLFILKKRKQLTFKTLEKSIPDESALIPTHFPQSKQIDGPAEAIGDISGWTAFGKKPGIKIQLLKSVNHVHLWNEQFEIVTDKFPEVVQRFSTLDQNVHLLGQIVTADPTDNVESLSSRMKKKIVTAADVRKCAAELEIWFDYGQGEKANIELSRIGVQTVNKLNYSSWHQLDQFRANCRAQGFSGIVLSKKGSFNRYFIWKASSYAIRALLMYIEFGSMNATGIRSLTFGLNKGQELVPVAKVEVLPDEHILKEILNFQKEHTIERFGPVRTVTPTLVFELFFDQISPSARHKSKVKLENARLGKKINENAENVSAFSELESLLQ